MSERKLIVCNPGIFFEDDAPAVYPWLLDKFGKGEEARAIQAKYESIKANGPGLLPEMAALFNGIRRPQLELACREYCLLYLRRETFSLFKNLNAYGHCCMLVTSLPEEICMEFAVIVHMSMIKDPCIGSNVITSDGSALDLLNREDRKQVALWWVEAALKDGDLHGWDDVFVIGQSLTDVPLGKAVREKGGRFVAFHPKDTEIVRASSAFYNSPMEYVFEAEGLI